MSTQVPQTDGGEEPQELAERHEDVEVSREHISGTFEYEVVIAADKIEEIPDTLTPEDFAEKIAVSRLNRELDPTFRVDSSDAMAKEEQSYVMNGERRFTVWVRFDKND